MSGADHNTPGQMAVEVLNIQHCRPGLQAAAVDEKIPDRELQLICRRRPGEYSEVWAVALRLVGGEELLMGALETLSAKKGKRTETTERKKK